MERQKKLRIGVLFGGRSGEHEVSFCSAASVIEAINTEKYEVVPIGITKEGYWLSPEESSRALVTKRVEGNEFISWESKTVEHQFLVMSRKGKDAIYSFLEKLDVIFPGAAWTLWGRWYYPGLIRITGCALRRFWSGSLCFGNG